MKHVCMQAADKLIDYKIRRVFQKDNQRRASGLGGGVGMRLELKVKVRVEGLGGVGMGLELKV
jgi:hypothetical protein